MKLDFNQPIVGLDGNVIEGSNMGKILADQLAIATKGNALKFWEMATKLYCGEAIDLDQSDQSIVKDFIEKHESLPNLTKAQLLLVFIETEKKTKA
ncbi:hypothetical protein [Emticicia sp. BO119]|uniref:hypothetical protein n=1 Tax=Emticicia sp. BO119 TaxID=2757768 RepID=UPI0015F07C78|nr:hypothetical protein [Emticicia sp. BO119]MBA4851358.1 hypothetical protein [Emticicia sp. BO119]